MIEYAISAGPGTLVDYGVAEDGSLIPAFEVDDATRARMVRDGILPKMMFERCPDDCETGK